MHETAPFYANIPVEEAFRLPKKADRQNGNQAYQFPIVKHNTKYSTDNRQKYIRENIAIYSKAAICYNHSGKNKRFYLWYF